MTTVRRKPDTTGGSGARPFALVAGLLFSATLCLAQAPQQPPVFRGGTTLVQVDAIVSDAGGQPIVDLAAADFEALDDGRPVPIQRARFLGAEIYNGDPTLAPIRSDDDEEREASRDDVRVYA